MEVYNVTDEDRLEKAVEEEQAEEHWLAVQRTCAHDDFLINPLRLFWEDEDTFKAEAECNNCGLLLEVTMQVNSVKRAGDDL